MTKRIHTRWRGTSALAVTVLAAGMLGAAGLGESSASAATLTASSAATTPTVTTAALPAAHEGAVYRAKLAAAGGVRPYTWSIIGGSSLPAGLTLVPATGLITGIPSLQAPVDHQFTVRASDAGAPAATATAKVSLQLLAPAPLKLTTTSLPMATADVHYSQRLAATGGTAPYTWSVGGLLPAGLTLNSRTGVISGTPKTGGGFVVNPQVSCAIWGKIGPITVTASANLLLTVHVASLFLTTGALPTAIVGVPYSVRLDAAGGITPYTWTSASLPPGLKLHPATGVISGTPTAAGEYGFEVGVTDSESPSQSVTDPKMLMTVQPPLTIATTSLPAATAGSPYTAQLTASAGVPPYIWNVAYGSQLPAGLSLSPDGTITGVPEGSGTVSFSVQLTDSETPRVTVTTDLSITIGLNIQA